MDLSAVFYGPWTIEVTERVLGAGAPVIRLSLSGAGAADGAYLNPPVGTQLRADGAQWSLTIEVSFDLLVFGLMQLSRGFAFDRQRGTTATVRADWQNPAFRASLALLLTSEDPELRAGSANPFDFTIPDCAQAYGQPYDALGKDKR